MSSGGLGSAAASLQSCFSPTTRRCSSYSYAPTSLIPRTLSSPNLKLKGLRFSGPKGSRIYSNSSNRPGGADGGSASGITINSHYFSSNFICSRMIKTQFFIGCFEVTRPFDSIKWATLREARLANNLQLINSWVMAVLNLLSISEFIHD